ncbi:N-acetylmuramoyl-L-alanine amidase [Fictibacillus sp. NRS-1165]|uniref:N-acetylmuramoyl-L-alanine amidase n=1 Tax=Fictibacillus sp. NRS-1165 TaxID=3144463 RepID=UPI003D23CD30
MNLVVYVDAGHGPDTPGKRSPDGSLREHFFNHATAVMLMGALTEYEDVTVVQTYNHAEDTPLKARTDKANAMFVNDRAKIQSGDEKQIFISIHANAMTNEWTDHAGIETWVYTEPSNESLNLASHVQNRLIRNTGRKNRGVKRGNLHIVRETQMPAILVESGFMTNREECELLKTKEYQQLIATSIEQGIADVYGIKKKAETTPPKAPDQEPSAIYKVQVGAFSLRENAERMVSDLKKKGITAIITKEDE